MNKLIPLLAFSILLLVTVGTQNAFAGPTNPPFALTKISGDLQSGVVGIPLAPFVVQVTDEFGNPLQDIAVSFELLHFGDQDQLSCVNAFTDSQGMASCTLTPQEEADFHVIISVFGSSTIEPVTCRAFGFFDNNQVIGGEIISIESTSILLANTQSFSFMIPVLLSVLGIGIFVASKKNQ